jgi:hypothetical protein
MTTVAPYVSRFLSASGVIPWEPDAVAGCRLDASTAMALQIAAVLEEDTAISAAHARSLGLDRAADMGAFLPRWEVEEAEHGGILRALVAATAMPDIRSKAIVAHRRRVAALPLRGLGRFPATGLVYCTLGAAAEHLAITSYTALVARSEHPTVVSSLRAIIRQEGSHLAFFAAAARARGEAMSSAQGRLARRALIRLWQPIGVSSLGWEVWCTRNREWVDDERLRARAARMDALIDTIPHLAGLRLMDRFLHDWDRDAGTISIAAADVLERGPMG